MHSTLRRAVSMSAALVLGVAVIALVPGIASATTLPVDNTLPAPVAEFGGAYDNGTTGSYELDFNAPAPTHDATKVLTGYTATLFTDSPSFDTVFSTSTTADVSNSFFVFDGLAYGTAYQGAVCAIYSVSGVDTQSSCSNADVDTPLKSTPLPSHLTATPVASGKLKLHWTAPKITDPKVQPVQGYEIEAMAETNDQNQVAVVEAETDAGTTSITLHGLANGTTYDIVVTTGGFPLGFGSNEVEATPIGTPAKASGLKAAFHAGGMTTLTWKGAKSTKAAPVTGYHVYVNGKLLKSVGRSARSCTAGGEHNGRTYRYTVKAYNKVGSSKSLTLTKKRTTG